MEVFTAAVIAAAAAAVGLVAGLAFRASENSHRSPTPVEQPAVPPGVNEVLTVLRHSAVLLDDQLGIVKASPSSYAFGLVRESRLAVPELVDHAESVLRDGQIREVDLQLSRSRDSVHTLHVRARIAPLSHGLILVLVEDRTHAIRIDEIRRDFVANVSHELKTPVAALALLAEAVQDAADDAEAVARFAKRMQEEGDRLTKLVQEIIDLSRLQYDDPVESPDLVDVDAVVEAAVDRSRVDAEDRGISLVSGGHQGLHVLGNESQLVIALGNLVENAVAYSPSRSRVAVDVRRRPDQVEISVTDQGEGISEAEQERIFERFYRGDPARSRQTGGTGLGLAIVKHIAASHGGDVRVRSMPGAGSTFTVRLPRHATQTWQQPAPSLTARRAAS